MNAARKLRMLTDLVLAAEDLAARLDQFNREGGLMAVDAKEGDPIVEFGPGGEPQGYGAHCVREFRRALEDARREGLVP